MQGCQLLNIGFSTDNCIQKYHPSNVAPLSAGHHRQGTSQAVSNQAGLHETTPASDFANNRRNTGNPLTNLSLFRVSRRIATPVEIKSQNMEDSIRKAESQL